MLSKLPKLQPEIKKTKLKVIKKGIVILNCSCLMFNWSGGPAMAQEADSSGAAASAASEIPKQVVAAALRGCPSARGCPPPPQPEPQTPEKGLIFNISGGPAIAQAADLSQIPRPVEPLPPPPLPEPQTPEKGLNFNSSGGPAIAQAADLSQIPRPVEPLPPPPLPEPQTPEKLPPPEQLLQPPAGAPTPQPSEQLPEKVPGTITVERFEFEGNTAFSDQELREALEPFTGRSVTFAELLEARSIVTKKYTDAGYITSGALIPPQTLNSGVVTIQVVEGEVEDIKVTGIDAAGLPTKLRLDLNYVRRRVALGAGKPLNVNRLLESLQLLQLNPLIKTISAELSAGSRAGSSVVEVTISEAQSFNVQVTLDNGRSPSVGTFRRQVSLSEGNLVGHGDSLSLIYTNTEGSNAIEGSYTLPVNARNGTVRVFFSRTDSNIIEPPFEPVDIEATSRNYELTLRQPVVESPRQEIALGLTATRRESDTTLLGVPFRLSPGANEEGQTRLNALRFVQEYTQRGAKQVFAARSQFSLGVGWRATVNDKPPDSRFFSWRGQMQWVRQLAPDTVLVLRSDAQISDRAMLPIEQFGLGGQESVRGYRQDALLTDSGVFGSAEVRVPIYRLPNGQGVLLLTPFIDAGTVWNSSGNKAPDYSTLLSVGLGLRFQLGDRLTARLEYGIPLIDIKSSDRTWQEQGIYFSIVGSFF
jgi:hemolysin activation/secretion protein